MRARSCFACLSIVAAMVACSGSTEKPPPLGNGGGVGAGGSGDGGSNTLDDAITTFCDAVVEPFCEALFACCTDPIQLDQAGGSVNGCKALLSDCEQQLADGGIDTLLDMDLTELDSTKLDACVSALESLSAGACTQPPKFVLLTCHSAFQGKVAARQSCGIADNDITWVECADGYCFDGNILSEKIHGRPVADCRAGDVRHRMRVI